MILVRNTLSYLTFVPHNNNVSTYYKVTARSSLRIGSTNGRIFFKLYSNVQLNKVICKTHVTFVPAQGQGHTWRSKLTCPLYKSYTNGRIFFKLYLNVQPNKFMCRTHNLTHGQHGFCTSPCYGETIPAKFEENPSIGVGFIERTR